MSPELETVLEIPAIGTTLLFTALAVVLGEPLVTFVPSA